MGGSGSGSRSEETMWEAVRVNTQGDNGILNLAAKTNGSANFAKF